VCMPAGDLLRPEVVAGEVIEHLRWIVTPDEERQMADA